MKMKNITAKYVAGALLFGLCLFAGCGDDAASIPVSPNTGVTSSSSVAEQQNPQAAGSSSSSENISNPILSSSSLNESVNPTSSSDEALSSSSTGTVQPGQEFYTFQTTPGALAIVPDADGFYDAGDVYKAVPKTSKIAFVLRHSKREKTNTGKNSTLTPIGIEMAQTLGAKLAGDESFYYASTDFVRTRATCENIAIGRGETAEVVTWDEGIYGGYFLTVSSSTLDSLVSKLGGNPRYIAMYAYGDPFPTTRNLNEILPTYFHDFFQRGNQFINEVIVANMPNWKRVSVLVSHDMLVAPLIILVSKRTIDLKIYETANHWVNYISGIAVIVDEAGVVTALPVRGADVGWMSPREEVDEGV